MIPKPPFANEISLEREIEEFELLKPRLERLWDVVFADDDGPYTSIVVPSLTLDRSELAKIHGVAFYEERLLFFLMRLRNPRARLVYVTSQPIHPMVLDYYLQLLAGIPASHARARLSLLCAYDNSSKPLTEKILERPRLLQRMRESITDTSQAYLTVFNVTPLERKLAVLLGVPINGVDPRLTHLGSKTGSKRIFREAGVPCPDSVDDIHTIDEVESSILELWDRNPSMTRAVVKFNESFGGEGNAIVHLPETRSLEAVAGALRKIRFSVDTENYDSYFTRLEQMGGIVEMMVHRPNLNSPSVQIRIDPRRNIILASTHEQLLDGPLGQTYQGCIFPARDEYRLTLQDYGVRIGEVLAAYGVVGRLSVDYITWEEDGRWIVNAIEINLRMGGTTHPQLALRFLTGGDLDPATGMFFSPSGLPKFYRASDNLVSERYRGLLPEDLIEILTVNRLDYSHRTETGVLFHMIGAISQFGKVGVVAIGNSRDEADAIFLQTLTILDHETRFGHP